MAARPRWSRLITNHLVIVLLALLCVYLYRDVWPLATFTKHPLDNAEGWMLWAKTIILAVISVIIPLFMPRHYVPFDPKVYNSMTLIEFVAETDFHASFKEPAAVPNPEQTASLISLLLWFFLDPIVFLAYKIPHLSHDQLPTLADYDQAKNLVKKSFPSLDPFSGSKKRHLFWGLMSVYREFSINILRRRVITLKYSRQ